jgi:hypothetical protein
MGTHWVNCKYLFENLMLNQVLILPFFMLGLTMLLIYSLNDALLAFHNVVLLNFVIKKFKLDLKINLDRTVVKAKVEIFRKFQI